MPNDVTHMLVTTEIATKNPPIIKVVDVIEDAAGELEEALMGGQVTYRLTLSKGKEVAPLTAGESVFVSGKRNGEKFRIPFALTAESVKNPWTFSGKSGSTGP